MWRNSVYDLLIDIALTCKCILGVGANVSLSDGHHAPGSTVLCSRACVPEFESQALDTVIWSSGIGDGPLTNGISTEQVGAT